MKTIFTLKNCNRLINLALVMFLILIGTFIYIDFNKCQDLKACQTELDSLNKLIDETLTNYSSYKSTLLDQQNSTIEEQNNLLKDQEQQLNDLKAQLEQLNSRVDNTNLIQTNASSSKLTKESGVNYFNGNKETYYSSNVLQHYRLSEWTADSDGVYRDRDGYVVVANVDNPLGSTISTSFGMGKVYDTGCASGVVDVYTNW